jgi:methylated-DNA-[protein]-cysteine S-methyltransferase
MSNTRVNYTVLATPIDRLLLTSDGTALTGVYMEPHPNAAARDAHWRRDETGLGPALEQLTAYFAGTLRRFDLRLAPRGTAFQQSVWQALCEIPLGTTVSYAEIARRVGAPGAARAVGAAVGRNPIPIVVPCHRVVGSNGSLTGFGGGLPRKEWLLEHERLMDGGACQGRLALVAADGLPRSVGR